MIKTVFLPDMVIQIVIRNFQQLLKKMARAKSIPVLVFNKRQDMSDRRDEYNRENPRAIRHNNTIPRRQTYKMDEELT